jgi:hypothetical protein
MQVRPGSAPHLFEVESETSPATWYQVFANGTVVKCSCKGYLSTKHCKHLNVVQQYLHQANGEKEADAGSESVPASSSPLAKWMTKIHGKDFIKYEGLLAMAHDQGLTVLGAAFLVVTSDLALAYAWAAFKDGRRFSEASDATPDNVHERVRPHFARVALTRAKARVLRDALNIGVVAVEELGDDI